MSWLQAFDVCIPHYDLQGSKFVFALALEQRSGLPRPRSLRASLTAPSVTARRSYSEFRRLWKDLERATRTPNALAAATAALGGDAKSSTARRSCHSRSSSSSVDSNASSSSTTSSSSLRSSLRFSSPRTPSVDSPAPSSCQQRDSEAPVSVSAASGCLCSNFCCPFARLHGFLKAYNFPTKFVLKKSAQAVLDSRRNALELFFSRLRAQFDQFPRLLLERVEASERCIVLELLARFVGFSAELRASFAPSRMPLSIAPWRTTVVTQTHYGGDNNSKKTASHTDALVTKPDLIDDEVEAAEICAEINLSETDELETGESPSHSQLFVPQLSPWPEETIDENGAYEDESLGETMPVDLDQDEQGEEEEEETPERSYQAPSAVSSTPSRQRSATDASTPRHEAAAPRLSDRISQNLPVLHIRRLRTHSVRSFIDDVRGQLTLRRGTRSRSSGSGLGVRRSSSALDATDERQWTRALFVAAQIGHANAAAAILRHGTDPNTVGEDKGVSALHVACRGGHREVAVLLLAAGAEVNTRDARGMTPLHSAIHSGDLTLVRQLLAAGADVHALTANNVSAVHVAVACQAHPILKLLLERGADVNAANAYNRRTPLHMAAELGDYAVCELLLRRGADTHARTDRGVDAVALAFMNGRLAVAELCRQYQRAATLRTPHSDSQVAELDHTRPSCAVYTTAAGQDQSSGAASDEDDSGCGLVVPSVTFISEYGQRYAVL